MEILQPRYSCNQLFQEPGTRHHSFQSLPIEIQHQVLTNLPLPSLLRFAQTNSHNYRISTVALTTLHLAVFPKKAHGVLAYLSASPNEYIDEAQTHQIVVPRFNNEIYSCSAQSRSRRGRGTKSAISPKIYRQQLLTDLHNTTTSILSGSCLSNLRTLTLHTYTGTSSSNNSRSLANVLATRFPNLRHLILNFAHPYVNDSCLPAHYWTIPDAGSPVWNALGALGQEYEENTVRLRNLERLEVNRAGITARQLLEWINLNPRLSELKLTCVSGVDLEFVEGLVQLYDNNATYGSAIDDNDEHSRKSLACQNEKIFPVKRVRLTNLDLSYSSPFLIMQATEEAEWITSLVSQGLEHLSLRSCKGVDSALLTTICEEQQWMKRGLKSLDLGLYSGKEKFPGLLGAVSVTTPAPIPHLGVASGFGSSSSSSGRCNGQSLSDGEEDALAAFAGSSSWSNKKPRMREVRPPIEMNILEVDLDA